MESIAMSAVVSKSTFLDVPGFGRHDEQVMFRTASCACCRTGCPSGRAAVRLALLI